MLSPASLSARSPSPGLTESSGLEQFLDLDSLIDDTQNMDDRQLLFADSLQGLEPLTGVNAESDEFMRLLMDQSKPAYEQPFVVPSLDEAPATTLDPHALTTPSPNVSLPTPEEEDEEMAEEDDDMYRESEDEDVKPRKTRSSSRRKSAAKSAARTSVADLALPIDPARPIASSSTAHGKLPHMVHAVPEYIDKPSSDAYKKMSSKEKRQYRNKVSARNFRHRRKEYIGELEGTIAQRDSTITLLQDEVSQLKVENEGLRKDMSMLRKEFQEAMAKFTGTPVAPSPVPSPPLQPTGNAPEQPVGLRRGRSSAFMPNMNKDVLHNSSWGPGGFSGISRDLGVHHTILPERHPDLSGKPRNLNPLLRGLEPLGSDFTGHLRPTGKFDVQDEFVETSPFNLGGDAANAMRGQLYAKIAHNQAGPPRAATNDKSGLSSWRPAFFTSPSASLSGKPAPASPLDEEEEKAAYVAGAASTTLFRRMASAFADAFAGPTASTSQVADVLAGRAQVRIVPVVAAPAKTATEEISEKLASLNVNNQCLTSSLFVKQQESESS